MLFCQTGSANSRMEVATSGPENTAVWLGQAFNPMTTVIDKRDEKDNPYWRACHDGELNFEIEGIRPVIPVNRIQERVSLLDQFEAARTDWTWGMEMPWIATANARWL